MWKIQLHKLNIGNDELDAVKEALTSGWLALGKRTEEFEQNFADKIGAKHAVAVANGTAALHLANRILGIGPGDEVICPTLTFVAGANMIREAGADVVFADIESLDRLTISPTDIRKKISPKTKAIQVMHYAGYPCDMTAIGEIAAEHGLSVIEDCAHSPGARHKEQFCGTLGDVGCFSFYANKNLTTGEGGMLVTNSDNLAASARLLRSHGMTSLAHNRHSDKTAGYDVQALGYNYAIDEIRSALGLVQLKKLDNANNLRRQARKSYCEFLSGIPGLSVPFSEAEYGAVPHIMSVILPLSIDRTKVIEHMHNAGIQTSIHYPAIHKFSYYQKSAPNGNPGLELSEEAEGRLLTLPLYPELAVTEIKTVCQTFASAVELYAAI